MREVVVKGQLLGLAPEYRTTDLCTILCWEVCHGETETVWRGV